MATSSEHLGAEYGKVEDLLARYPAIKLIHTSGNPPDEYELEYQLRGYVQHASGIGIDSSHRVRISLTFGYPQFAPLVRALSPIYHPAVVEAEIFIEEWWRDNPSLPALILYLAELIRGQIFVFEEPRNAEAAQWYARHEQDLPLDALSREASGSASTQSATDEAILELDVDDAPSATPAGPDYAAEIQEIRDLLIGKQFFTLKKRLAELPADVDFPERAQVEARLDAVQLEMSQLVLEAEELEDLNQYAEAAALAERLVELSPDDPTARSLQRRLEQSLLVNGSLGDALAAKKKKPQAAEEAEEEEEQRPPPKRQRPWSAADFPYRVLFWGFGGLLFGLGLLLLTFKDMERLDQATQALQQGQALIAARQFTQARQTLQSGRSALQGLSVLRFRKSVLDRPLETALALPELEEGLLGKVLYQGVYMDAAQAAALTELARLEEEAEALSGQQKYAEALMLYKKAQQDMVSANLPKEQAAIATRILLLETQALLAQGRKAEESALWQRAGSIYKQALHSIEQAQGAEAESLHQEVLQRLTLSGLEQKLIEANDAMQSGQWPKAQSALEQAERLAAAQAQMLPEQGRQALEGAKLQMQIHQLLTTAKDSFDRRQWAKAASEYQRILSLIDAASPEAQRLLAQTTAKISSACVLAQINDAKEKMRLAQNQGNWNKVMEEERNILRIVRSGRSEMTPELSALRNNFEAQLSQHREMAAYQTKIRWLERNAEQIFRRYYPTFNNAAVQQARAVFVRREGRMLIFRLSCMDTSGGRGSLLTLNYGFDEGSGQWSLVSE